MPSRAGTKIDAFFRVGALSLLLALHAVAAVAADQSPVCSTDKTICVGDSTFAYSERKLIYGKIDQIGTNGEVKLQPSALSAPTTITLPRDQVASVRSETCRADKGQTFCPGAGTERTVNGKKTNGLVLAVFPTGYLVVAEPDAAPVSLKKNRFTKREIAANDDRDLRLVLDQFEGLKKWLRLESERPCPGCAVSPEKLKSLLQKNPDRKPDCSDTGLPPPLNSPNRARFEALLQKGMSAPLDDFLILWNPSDVVPNTAIYYEACTDPTNRNRPTRSNGIRLVAECAPDTLYSWGPLDKLVTVRESLPTGADWDRPPNGILVKWIWASRSPLSTYTYGKIPIRLRVRRGTSFYWNDHSPDLNSPVVFPGWLDDTVFHKATSIESWSYGTAEHYDEIIKDLLRLRSGDFFWGYQAIGRNLTLERITVAERNSAGEDTLKTGLLEMIRMILAGEGRIYYGKGVCRSRTQHFATNRPTYFNER